MNEQQILIDVLRELDKSKSELNYGVTIEVPIGVSARHCHLAEEDVNTLFGTGYQLTKYKNLYQPGQFAANETVTIVGPKGSIQQVRILGPVRKKTQIEVSKTDAYFLGLNPPIRMSGDVAGSSPVTVVGPRGSIYVEEGLIIAKAHIHMNSHEAEQFMFQDGQEVEVKLDGMDRSIQLGNVQIRVSPNYKLELHIDTDEANAAFVTTGMKGYICK